MNFSIPARYVLVIMGSFGYFCTFTLRVIMNVAIVAMVQQPVDDGHLHTNQSIATCPELITITRSQNGSVKNLTFEGKGEFQWNSHLQGLVLGSFYYGHLITQIPGGVIAEAFGAKFVFGTGLLVTSVLSLLMPLAARWSVWALIAARVVQGLGEGVCFPAMNCLIGRWAPKHEISRLSAIFSNGGYIGIVVSFYLSGMISNSDYLGGWPSTFYLFGILGCIGFVFWILFVYDSPLTHPRISQEELLDIQLGMDGKLPERIPIPWKSILTSKCVWGLIITHVSASWGFFTLLTDMPIYLSNVLHYDLGMNGALSAVTNVLPVFLSVFSSVIADKLVLDGRLTVTTIRKIFNSIGVYVPSLCLLIIAFIGCHPTVIIACLAISVGSNAFIHSGFLVTHVHLSPELAGTLMGLTNFFGGLTGFLAPSVVGYLIQDGSTVENWKKVFLLTSAIYFVSGTTYNIMCNAERQSWGSSQRPAKKLSDSKNSVESPYSVPEEL